MELILIRHTTPDIKKGICYGQTDIDVINTFSEEIKPIQKQVSFNNDDTVYYSSPLKRCKILAEKLSDKIIFDDRLKELDFGDWELKDWNDIDKNDLDIWMNDFVNEPTKNGESYIDLHKRTTSFLEEIKLKNHTKIIVITHAGVIRSLASYINKTSLKDSFDLKLNYGAIIKFNI